MSADLSASYALAVPHDERIEAFEWKWIPYLAVSAAAGAALIAVAQRDALFPPKVEVLIALAALSPWLAEHLTPWIAPRWLFAAVVTTAVVGLMLDPSDNLRGAFDVNTDFAPFILLVMLTEVAATGRSWEGPLAAVGTVAALVAVDVSSTWDGAGVWGAGLLAAGALGLFTRAQLELVEKTRAMQATHAEQAATDERRRIAREVHDVVAHSMSVTMLHLTGARHSLETGGDVDDAVDALRDAEHAGRQSLADIRRIVGLLAPESSGLSAPEPGAVDIADLVAGMAAAGLDVTFEVKGDPSSVPLATGLGLYRIAQESLANAARHAPGAPVSVRLEIDDDEARLAVKNGAAAPGAVPLAALEGAGTGLRGMQQRAALLGGAFRAGPHGGGWLVEVSVPEPAA